MDTKWPLPHESGQDHTWLPCLLSMVGCPFNCVPKSNLPSLTCFYLVSYLMRKATVLIPFCGFEKQKQNQNNPLTKNNFWEEKSIIEVTQGGNPRRDLAETMEECGCNLAFWLIITRFLTQYRTTSLGVAWVLLYQLMVKSFLNTRAHRPL